MDMPSEAETAVPTKRGTDAMFGNAPPGYVPGRGRGATGFIGGVSRDEAKGLRLKGLDASGRWIETTTRRTWATPTTTSSADIPGQHLVA